VKGKCPKCGSELEMTFGATTDPEAIGYPILTCTNEECDFAFFFKGSY